jgi:hypothetical protein
MSQILLLMCQISMATDAAIKCEPPRPQSVQVSWEACMEQSDERNKAIMRAAREKLWPPNWQYVCEMRHEAPRKQCGPGPRLQVAGCYLQGFPPMYCLRFWQQLEADRGCQW